MVVINIRNLRSTVEHDDGLEQYADRYCRNLACDGDNQRFGSLQRGDLRQRGEQVYAHAELQVRPRYLYLLQGMLLLPQLSLRRMLLVRR